MEEKSKIVDQLILQQKLDQQKRFYLSSQAQRKRKELSEEFNKSITMRKSIDDDEKSINMLAKKFNVNMDEIKKKYSRKQVRSSLSSVKPLNVEEKQFSVSSRLEDQSSTIETDVTIDNSVSENSVIDDAPRSNNYMVRKSYPKSSQTGINFDAVSDCGYTFKYVPISQD